MNKQTGMVVFSLLLLQDSIQAAGLQDDSPSRRWLNVPWEVRYLLFTNTQQRYAEGYRLAKLQNTLDGKKGKSYVYLDALELIKPTANFVTPGARTITTGIITFDQQGDVTTPDGELRKFSGKLSALENLVLVQRTAPMAKSYELLFWAQGIPGNLAFAPGPCTMLDTLRYEDEWRSGDKRGDFGCREWTAQLFNDARPYIDVTTYTKRGNFIGEFVGWSRFKDAPKPVIGMNGKTWLCLHECPAGETPGVIGDIKAWTRKHRYPMPVPPPYQPEYPNKNYYDDLHEMDED
ncbi:hypothetical protein GTP55_00345 [Duganella sp. FT109W]|uniref:Uncharacterized protein n=1 Tax=Duganella margarita TaxID=2692170 RepID=A0ABW9WAJ0_9BURK|nr:hypothetical protein [Duganella margarita]MYN37815.1 hypothetical protein [Duganella margarita]